LEIKINYTEMHGQQIIKTRFICLRPKSPSDLKPKQPPNSKRYSNILFISLKSPDNHTPSGFPNKTIVDYYKDAKLQVFSHAAEVSILLECTEQLFPSASAQHNSLILKG
jgi:hypothetical protein